jgi:Domain of unknown function (DUF4190)
MTTPGDSSERPPEDQPTPGQESTPFDQAETQFAQIPPPEYQPPAYAPPPPPPPPESGAPPSGYPPPSYPPPSYTPPQGGYPPSPQSYQPPPGGYPPQPPYQPGPQPPYQSGPQPPYQPGYPSAPYAGGYGAPQRHTNGMAIGSLVASLVGVPLMFLCYTGILAAIVGIVLGIIAINQIKQSGEEGRGFAIAGIIIGAVTLLLTVVLIIIGVGYYAVNR